jgi:salicylate hydroxylase
MSNLPKISINIAGGGIGGLSLATGLQKYPQLDVHVYEGTKLY